MSLRLLLSIALTTLAWGIRTGFAGDESSLAEVAIIEYPITDSDRDHWSYQPIMRPQPPQAKPRPSLSSATIELDSSWPQTAVDEFIVVRLNAKQLNPMPPADRGTLLRRLSYDLIGLPPTPAELSVFEHDNTPLAYERLVDRLLASPAYGERWAQHWLDLARFAETDGFEHDRVRDQAWQYRQWVIDAFNADMPYDQFVQMQLTGDLSADHIDAIATMFCLAGPDMPDQNEQDLRRHDKLNEITSTVGAVLLGLQMHCAQCHDHKYDPVSQADFYRLRGIFEASIPELKRDQPIIQLAAQLSPISPRIYLRGELQNAGPIVKPKPPRIACATDVYEQFDSSHPRPALAQWLFAADNPLTARVIANRIWQHHFGQSLCENPSDVGLIADGPSHPELLDWLACEIRDHGWSIKHLHRVILLSATYRQASHVSRDNPASITAWEHTMAVDANNTLYSRFPRKRLEGEIIRDALLAVSGQLDQRYGGRSVMPPLPPELLKTLLPGQWKTSTEPGDQRRRSVYLFARRNLRYPIFEAFDRPDAGASCARRDRSTTAIQSLQMLNSDLAWDAAKSLRGRLLDQQSIDKQSPATLVEQLFLHTLARRPTATESQRLCELWEASPNDSEGALLVACIAVLNASEFVYVD